MWSFNFKPQAIVHGHVSKYNEFVYIVEIFASSCMIERHVFFNKRKYESFLSHIKHVLPYSTRYTGTLSYSNYDTYYSPELYDDLTNL